MLLPVSSGSQAPATGPDLTGADRVGCSEQSSAGFPGAYRSRRNLVVGPLAMIGGSSFTERGNGPQVRRQQVPAARARRPHGDGVDPAARPRHGRAELRLARRRRPGPAAHDRLQRVLAAALGQPRRRRRVTFWSGFVLASAPICVPLDVYVDGATAARRVHIELGRRCPQPPPPLRGCATHVEGGKPSDQLPRQPGTVTVGPFEFAGLARVASRRGLEHHRAPRGGYAIKSGVCSRPACARRSRSPAAPAAGRPWTTPRSVPTDAPPAQRRALRGLRGRPAGVQLRRSRRPADGLLRAASCSSAAAASRSRRACPAAPSCA